MIKLRWSSKTLDKNESVAEVVNNFFINVVLHFNIPQYRDKSVNIDHIKDPITRSIEQYKNHPSIVAIKSKTTNKYFNFSIISKSEFEKEILNRQHVKIPIYQQKLSNLIQTFLQMPSILNSTDL